MLAETAQRNPLFLCAFADIYLSELHLLRSYLRREVGRKGETRAIADLCTYLCRLASDDPTCGEVKGSPEWPSRSARKEERLVEDLSGQAKFIHCNQCDTHICVSFSAD